MCRKKSKLLSVQLLSVQLFSVQAYDFDRTLVRTVVWIANQFGSRTSLDHELGLEGFQPASPKATQERLKLLLVLKRRSALGGQFHHWARSVAGRRLCTARLRGSA